MVNEDEFMEQIVETDEGGVINLVNVFSICEQAEFISTDAESFESIGAERWEMHVKMKDGKHYMLQWSFPEDIVRKANGEADCLPWHRQEYIFRADRYEFGEEEEKDE